MLKQRLLIGFSALSIAALAATPLTYAHDAQPGDDRGNSRQEVQVNDDRGADGVVEVQAGDDRGLDAAPHVVRGERGDDDDGVDPAPHTW